VTSDFRTNFQAYSGHYRLGWLGGAIAAYLRRFHNHTGCTMVPTEALRSELQAAGFERVVVVARGVDTQLFDPARRSDALRRQWGVGADDGVVLYVGRLAAEKNLDVLVQAYAAMRQLNPRLRLVLVGDGARSPGCGTPSTR
jgi:glycosyltransferase involved in cell wall biosynthesis